MNLGQHPDLLDRLACAYSLGQLQPRPRRRFEHYARQSASVRARILLWQERMASMTELQSTLPPSPNVWKRIEIGLANWAQHSNQAASSSSLLDDARASLAELGESLKRWRRAAWGAGALASVALIVGALTVSHLQGRFEETTAALNQSKQALQGSREQLAQARQQAAALAEKGQIQYVAVLADAQATANILVTFDPGKKQLLLQRVGGYQESEDKSLQLWALPPGAAPQSLGVMSREKVLKLTAASEQIQGVPTLAISLEPKGGVPSSGGPTGPVLFKGALLQTAL